MCGFMILCDCVYHDLNVRYYGRPMLIKKKKKNLVRINLTI